MRERYIRFWPSFLSVGRSVGKRDVTLLNINPLGEGEPILYDLKIYFKMNNIV